jgi:hypothetical protein
MDNETFDLLEKLNLKNAQLIKLKDFETPELKEAKANRGRGEYCWTCSSSQMYYVLLKNDIKLVAYLDADLYFYSSPDPIYKEMGNDSITIIPHHFPPEKKYLEANGLYNVSMVIFRKDENGLACLDWWRKECLKWCYNRYEDGKMGDQKYLDEFPEKFKSVHILKHKGANLAPWSLKNYVISYKNNKTYIDEDELIFFHFYHDFKIYPPSSWLPSNPPSHYILYTLKRKYIYLPYIKEIYRSFKTIQAIQQDFLSGFLPRPNALKLMYDTFIYRLKYFVKSIYYR